MPGDFRHGRLGPDSLHLCVDMQNLFGPGGPWATPWFERTLPQVERLVRARPAATVFTRFIPPERAEDMPGTWRPFYRHWHAVTRAELDPELLQLAPALRGFAPPALLLDKCMYSAFHRTALAQHLLQRSCSALIVSGTETDVCVLSSVMDAVDLGQRVVVVQDAICSSSDRTHDALLTLYRERFAHQIEVASCEDVLANWDR